MTIIKTEQPNPAAAHPRAAAPAAGHLTRLAKSRLVNHGA